MSQVLKGLNLKLSAGETLALVGASGSGKTSVVKLIQRLYDVESGEVSEIMRLGLRDRNLGELGLGVELGFKG